jgi:hypothetical protein
LDDQVKINKRKANVVDVGGKFQGIGNISTSKKRNDG